MAELIHIPGHKRPFLAHKGYMYYYHSTAKGRTYWRCRNTPECEIRATTVSNNGGVEVVRAGSHEHASNFEQIEAAKI